MLLNDFVDKKTHLCGVELAFEKGTITLTDSGQPFYNSIHLNRIFEKIKISKSSIEFLEESNSSPAGVVYNQKLGFRFADNDNKRAERLVLLEKIVFAKVNFTNGHSLLIGRNDFEQNTNPISKIKSNGKICQVEIETKSMYPVGNNKLINNYLFPMQITIEI